MRAQGCGVILNVGSISGIVSNIPQNQVAYNSSKAAVHMMTKSLASELAKEHIRVNAVAPGLVETELHAANGAPDRLDRLAKTIPKQRAGSPIEIAEGVVWLLSPAASYTTGSILEIGGGR